ncbi:MIT domain-containing protein [Histoplasma ohiense]|nr:MIT domain-containing protein [Histoplasma ohiense (nom. inval.)]
MNRDKQQDRENRAPSQKTMLSKALQKANAAVLLDNATNYEGAIDAYNDACQLLQHVMHHSGGHDEKQKLEEIRNTYTSRVTELRRLGLPSQRADGKALPEPPQGAESPSDVVFPSYPMNETEYQDTPTPVVSNLVTNDCAYSGGSRGQRSLAPSQIPPRRQSLLASVFDEDVRLSNSVSNSRLLHDRSQSKSFKNAARIKVKVSKETLKHARLDPATTGKTPSSPNTYSPPTEFTKQASIQLKSSNPLPPLPKQHSRDASNESISWLDTIDESGASSSSSIRSRSSLFYIRPKHGRNASDGTEAEFDAALDAAVEAAYDQGFEPVREADSIVPGDIISNARRNVELAKQKVREAQIESEAALARNNERRILNDDDVLLDFGAVAGGYDEDVENEEEERILEEMMADFEFDLQSKSALPRQSDSSGFSGRTWGSSIGSSLTTAGNSLSTLAEGVEFQSLGARVKPTSSPPHPPPISALPPPPVSSSLQSLPPLPPCLPSPLPSVSSTTLATSTKSTSVRGRRANNGWSPKELSIETNRRQAAPLSTAVTHMSSSGPKTEGKVSVQIPLAQDATCEVKTIATNNPIQATPSASKPLESGHTDSITNRTQIQEVDDSGSIPSPSHIVAKVPSAPENLRKNISSSSLRAMKARGMSVSTPDIVSQTPGTPASASFANIEPRKVSSPSLPSSFTPTTGAFAANSLQTGGPYIFDNHIHSFTNPGSSNPSVSNSPLPLEPCPQSFLLRPFWLMRCLYQTIAHPRGGYITAKLFVPRDVWRVQNVKLKAVEEKISSCDLLTAALLKLAQADNYDAEAVLEEMQSLENVLDQVQNIWSKKLGNEVGVQGSMPLFKSSVEDTSTIHENAAGRHAGGSSKSYLTSWRKLRSKNSGTGSPAQSTSAPKDGGRDALTMKSLPMTDSLDFRTPKRNVTQLQCTGPNASYMSALARLFDAAQILDQIARQVEDPGLKHSSETLVGLELSARHASEFFGFYVCRFVLNDIGLMIDKFVKRGSEWVMV